MKAWKVLLIVIGTVVGLGLIGLLISKPKMPKVIETNDPFRVEEVSEKESKKYDKKTYQVTLTNQFESDYCTDDTYNIRADLFCNDNGTKVTKSFIMMFDKETGNLINEEDINFGFGIMENNVFNDIYTDVINKCKDEKLYKYTTLNMNYKTSSMKTK